MATCTFCEGAVDPADPDTYKQVKVWVGGPRKNSSKMSQDTGLYGHPGCVNDAARGVAPDQPPLIPE